MAVFLRPNRPPHWGMLAVLVSLAFLISIVWLNLVANEVVGVLTALGLLLNIKTGQTLIDILCSYVHRPVCMCQCVQFTLCHCQWEVN